MFSVYEENNRAFRYFGVWRNGQAAVTGLGAPEQVDVLGVTQGVLPALGVRPALGRWFSLENDTPGTPETVILGYSYWQRRFGGNTGVIGRTIVVDSRPHEIIGVMPAGFHFQGPDASLIRPFRFNRAQPPDDFSYT